jgi:CheY-like chemotaxis protein
MSPNVLSLTGPMRPTAPFPNSSRPETGSPAPRQKKADQQSINILLVDDQPAKLLSYEAILGELGDNLIKASSAAEALEQLLIYDIAVILVDVCMPELDGFELAAMIRNHPRFQSISIIFVSAVQVTDLDLLRATASEGSIMLRCRSSRNCCVLRLGSLRSSFARPGSLRR